VRAATVAIKESSMGARKVVALVASSPEGEMAPSASASDFARLSDEFLTALFEAHPTLASSLGLHEYDGRVQDFREAARVDRISALKSFAERLSAIPVSALDEEDAHDHTLLRLAADEERFELESLREAERNPLTYAGTLDVSGYVKRSYAPLPRRVQALTEHLRRFPDVLATARATLARAVARPFIETALEVYAGMVHFHETDLPAAVRPAGPGALWDAFQQANAQAISSVRAFLQYLTDELQPRATETFAIGEERYRTMLRLGEMVDLPLERLLEIGRADLARNAARARENAQEIAPGAAVRDVIRRRSHDHPPADRLVAEAERMLEELRRYVEACDLVSIPSPIGPRVEETPPFARWAFAMMDTAGPFETAPESFYYVTPPDPGWTPEETEAWLTKFDYATLRDVGIHEVYPGHYVHFLHMRHVPRRVRQVLTSYSFVEGWAHYCEEMMLDAGYGRRDAGFRLAQTAEALVRDVRFVVSIEMHTREMTLEAATRMFVEQAFMEPLPAYKEAARGTFDPGYLNYTLGKLMVRKLREDLRPAGSLRAFHDALLSLGAPPVPLARRRLLGQEAGAL
jgi:uncharacterized protein (DUF885 family)